MTFDERIALELDALDHLDTAESPVAECQTITFDRPQPDGDGENDVQHGLLDKAADVESDNVEHPEQSQVEDCDEVRIMIKVLGPKVSANNFYVIMLYVFNICLNTHKKH